MTYQIAQRLHDLNRIGHSKHQAKQDFRRASELAGVPWNPAQAPGIYSIATMQGYRQTMFEFTAWLKEHHPESRDLMNIPRQQAIGYLQNRQTEGKSAWTISKDMSALNKVCGFDITKKEAALRQRSYKDTRRSRVQRAHDAQYNPRNYERQIIFARAFGARRESIMGGSYQVKAVSIFRCGHKIYASLIEKNGRYREAPCLRSMQPQIEQLFPGIEEREPLGKREFVQLYELNRSQPPLFSSYTKKIDNHAFRSEYAMRLYAELVEQCHPEHAPRKLHRGYDEEVLRQVSEALGHSRLDVVVESYMRYQYIQKQDEWEG